MAKYQITSRVPSVPMSHTDVDIDLGGEAYGLTDPYDEVHDQIIQDIKAILLGVYSDHPDATVSAYRVDIVNTPV